ncbi:hypothetical protein NYZ99_20330 [Maribacter litopenaei]|uniref:Uncharacterized protein n=1 Tax=Maribacter litopenaei TaxID=2976127 RepID=A0ABY5Y9W7_9FLAO|nr:hypothetical protein [Maribacter litopenaei]UWX55019.1 hypothetical protein NYZ99_20330 [Maribacter litopenaei]
MNTNKSNKGSLKVYFFSAVIALAVSLGVIGINKLNQEEQIKGVTTVETVQGKHVLYTADDEGNIKPLDFTDTSKKVLDAVVHIKSTQTSPSYGNQGGRELPRPL